MTEDEYTTNEDGTVSIPLELDDDMLLILMKAAHEQNITFNQYMINVIMEYANTVLENGK